MYNQEGHKHNSYLTDGDKSKTWQTDTKNKPTEITEKERGKEGENYVKSP